MNSEVYSSSASLKFRANEHWSGKLYGFRAWSEVRVIEAYIEGEKDGFAARAGRVRLPFGIYDHEETYNSGLIYYPMARNDYAFINLDWTAPGVYARWNGGELQIEAAAQEGSAISVWNTDHKMETQVARVQINPGDWIVGVSHWQGKFAQWPNGNQNVRAKVSGLDIRYSNSKLLVRGEVVSGKFLNPYRGAYVDLYYRVPGIEKLTLVGRLDYLDIGGGMEPGKMATIGARYVFSSNLMAAVNFRSHNGFPNRWMSWVPSTGGKQDVLFQLAYTISR